MVEVRVGGLNVSFSVYLSKGVLAFPKDRKEGEKKVYFGKDVEMLVTSASGVLIPPLEGQLRSGWHE